MGIGAAVFGIMTGWPDKSTAVFDGTYTVSFYDTRLEKNIYGSSFSVNPAPQTFRGSYKKDQYCIKQVEEYYSSLIYSGIVEKIGEGKNYVQNL